jgi:hypothetical protein
VVQLPSVSLCSNHVAFKSAVFPTEQAPDQHIRRDLNPAWTPPPPPQRGRLPRPRRGRGERGGRSPAPPQPPQPLPTMSKFRVRRYVHDGQDYWNPWNLLGLFLSLMGPAPDGATKRSFYLPMTAVYGRWCSRIAGSFPRNGTCDTPYMFQCTWCIPSRNSSKPTRFSLGSSLAGFDWRPELTGTWKETLKHARFDLVDGDLLQQAGYDFDNSPVIAQRGVSGTKFGNCAETYPFLDLLMYVVCFFKCRVCY